MALAIARLRLAALASLRRDPRGIARAALPWIVAVVLAAAIIAIAVRGMLPSVLATTAVVVVAAGVGLLGARDAALDPRAFRGIATPAPVALGTAIGALVSPITIVALGVGIACGIDEGSPLGALAALLLAVTAALVRLVVDVGSARETRPWTAAAVLVVLAALALAPLVAGLEAGIATLAGSPFAASTGWLLVPARILVAIASIVVLAGLWLAIVAWRMARVGRPRLRAHLGLLRVVPARPWAVVAARTLTGWARDRRYHAIAIAVVALPVLLATPLWLAGMPRETWTLLPVGVLALFVGWSIHDDTAYDGSAWWMHLAARVPGWQDRLGRVLPLAVVATALVVAAAVIGVRVHGDESLVAPVLGAAIALLGSGLAVSSVVSAAWPYAVSGPEASVFQAPASQSWTAAFTQAGALLASAGVAAPIVVPVVLEAIDLRAPDAMWGWLGAGYAFVVVVLGIIIGGWILDRRGPEVLSSAMRD
ncbi:hypothetical protein [Agrococcus sp. SGAir0287]|uniref:hypothetical protein n=1 Tax=Agrococcus sp. SGAir0287 TaxID=2070347 RepID=UPI0010CD4C39|nr:hypothetical protein [Agrococcus sp. SGAir0287]QCR18901.1 hypothetical protein C1N71_05105 [Agrococcus sp. SGAir0287]